MAQRVAMVCLLVLCAFSPRPERAAAAGVGERAGIAQVLLGRSAEALDRLDGEGSEDRTSGYFRAVALLDQGFTGQALDLLRPLSDSDGAFSGPALERAVATLFGEGRYGDVVAWRQTSAAQRFQDPEALEYRVGQSYYLLGQTATARTQLEAVTSGEYLPYALHTLALIHYAEGRVRVAVDGLGEAVGAAERLADRALGRVLADRLRVTRGQMIHQVSAGAAGLAPEERGRLAALACEQFRKVDSDSPFYADSVRGAGWCSLDSGDATGALAAFTAAAGLDPLRRHEDLWAQGRVYERLGYFDEAAGMYATAREEALATAMVLESRSPAVPAGAIGPNPEAALWAARQAQVETLGRRLGAVRARDTAVVEALARRDERVQRARQQIQRDRLRVAGLTAELNGKATNLRDYLDQIPAVALFPKGARPRIDGLIDSQQRLDREIARVEGVFRGLTRFTRWQRASALHAPTAALWGRLTALKTDLGGAQLEFLRALKRRVSQREEELARTIAELRTQNLATVPLLDRGEAMVALAVELGERHRRRADEVFQRAERLDARIRALADEAQTRAAEAEQRSRLAFAQRLRLRADAYALDETQALHLWQTRQPLRDGGKP